MDYDIDDDPARIQRDVVWEWLSANAYWGRWRGRDEIEAQIAGAWRVVGVYRADTGAQIGFARAVSDGIGFAYLADVYIAEPHQGAGLGRRLLARMIDEGPGHDFRWTLFTRDAHTLYAEFGFEEPDQTAMVRRAAPAKR
ncbi:GNAT family N-acetyltransferase [Microbacterium sp. 2FI]|uniref:GNAT family N-acetyltransferase n=1 Tax=Microbacterium sp. 2FI TaxID=2502193 RepID=UPI0010FA3974|nr:GNAT family N-acetyltransferase [Microbacterium sp. 2FI]